MGKFQFALAVAIVFIANGAFAQIPRTLSYQGVLTDAQGNPKPDGQYKIVFRLYLNETGGTPQWTESTFVTTAKGLFSTALGDSTLFSPALLWNDPYWISIQVDAGIELAPRIKLATTAYSFRAIIADNSVTVSDGAITASKLAPNSVTAAAIQDGSVQPVDLAQAGANTGQALVWNGSQWSPATVGGGGTFTAGAGIDIVGNVISNTGDLSNTNEIQTLSLAGNQLSLSNGGGAVTLPGGGGANYWNPNGNDISNTNTGNVGIGTAAPQWKLDLQADGAAFRIDGLHPWMELWDGGARGGYFRNLNGNVEIGTVGSNTNGVLQFYSGGNEAMRLDKDGKLGIGTVSPEWKLDLRADGGAFRIDGQHPWMELWDGGVRGGYFRNLNGNVEIGTVNTNTNGSLAFWSGGTEKMRLTKEGKLGIGTTSPTVALHVQADNEALRLQGVNPYLQLANFAGNNIGYVWQKNFWNMEIGTSTGNTNGVLSFATQAIPRMYIDVNGNVGVGGMPGSNFHVFGECAFTGDHTWSIACKTGGVNWYRDGILVAGIGASGSWVPLSDRRLKKNILPYHPVLDGVKQLNVCTYLYKNMPDDSPRTLGLIAQDVQDIFPELVSSVEDKNGEKLFGISYAQTGVIALKAIQEQQELIEKLTRRIAELEKRLNER